MAIIKERLSSLMYANSKEFWNHWLWRQQLAYRRGLCSHPIVGQRGQHDSIQQAFFCLHGDSGSSTGCLFFSLGSKFPWHLVFGCGQVMPLGAHFSKLPRKGTCVTCQKAQCRFLLGLAFSPVKTKIALVRREVHRESCRKFIFIYSLPAFTDQRTT